MSYISRNTFPDTPVFRALLAKYPILTACVGWNISCNGKHFIDMKNWLADLDVDDKALEKYYELRGLTVEFHVCYEDDTLDRIRTLVNGRAASIDGQPAETRYSCGVMKYALYVNLDGSYPRGRPYEIDCLNLKWGCLQINSMNGGLSEPCRSFYMEHFGISNQSNMGAHTYNSDEYVEYLPDKKIIDSLPNSSDGYHNYVKSDVERGNFIWCNFVDGVLTNPRKAPAMIVIENGQLIAYMNMRNGVPVSWSIDENFRDCMRHIRSLGIGGA